MKHCLSTILKWVDCQSVAFEGIPESSVVSSIGRFIPLLLLLQLWRSPPSPPPPPPLPLPPSSSSNADGWKRRLASLLLLLGPFHTGVRASGCDHLHPSPHPFLPPPPIPRRRWPHPSPRQSHGVIRGGGGGRDGGRLISRYHRRVLWRRKRERKWGDN